MQKNWLFLLFALGCAGEEHGRDPSSATQLPTNDEKTDDPNATALPPNASDPPAVTATSDPTCGGQTFTVERVPPNVMLVLDRSGSMRDEVGGGDSHTKYRSLKDAISSLVNAYDDRVQFGLSLYPDPQRGDCDGGRVDVDPVAKGGQSVIDLVYHASANGGTPTGETLHNIYRSHVLEDAARENIIVLATDGVPECDGGDVGDEIQRFRKLPNPVSTFVIGIGSVNASNPDALNNWAKLGGTARATGKKYYTADTSAELSAAFDSILNGLVSCHMKLGQIPADTTQLYVWLGADAVKLDAADGYTYDAATQQIELHGATCDALKADAMKQVKVVYGCAAPPIL